MATIKQYIPPIKHLCQKEGLHSGQPLNIVCLDKIFRENPLACSVCYSEASKYHKVTSLNKFMHDYRRNTESGNERMLGKKIKTHYSQIKSSISKLKKDMNASLDAFMGDVDDFVHYLLHRTNVRKQVGKLTGVVLDAEEMIQLNDEQELGKSIKFILNNCIYDDNSNMANVSPLLKQDQERVTALLDKLVYQTENWQRIMREKMKMCRFAHNDLTAERSAFNDHVEEMWNSAADPTDSVGFNLSKVKLSTILLPSESMIQEHVAPLDVPPKSCPFRFTQSKHPNLQLKNSNFTVHSNVHCFKPQYALASPTINEEPQKVKQWSIKVIKCRDFASDNTMALGIAKMANMKCSGFENYPENALMVTSQGYTLLNGVREKTDFIFRAGDVIYFKYDPYYGILEVKKDNGRMLTLKAFPNDSDPLYICARFTYASDQIQIL